MITLLAKIFIKPDNKNPRKSYGTLCSVFGIFLNLVLFGIKYLGGVISGSVSVIADAINNLSDAASSVITLIGFAISGKKADNDHPFGHGRYEYVSGFVVSMVIILMGFELFKGAVKKILNPEPVNTEPIVMVILGIAIVIKLYMAFYNRKIGVKFDSAAMRATSMDSLSDAIATAVVLAVMLVMKFTNLNIDGYCGVLVALFVLYAGYKSAKDTINPILGFSPDKEFLSEVEAIVLSHELIEGVHDIIVHDYGPGRRMISLHVEVPGNISIFEIHEMVDHIEKELDETLHCESVIHMDPVEPDNEELAVMKEKICQLAKQIDSRITIHDFRMVAVDGHTNLVFDAEVPFEVEKKPDAVKAEIEERVEVLEGNFKAVVHIDQSYIR